MVTELNDMIRYRIEIYQSQLDDFSRVKSCINNDFYNIDNTIKADRETVSEHVDLTVITDEEQVTACKVAILYTDQPAC